MERGRQKLTKSVEHRESERERGMDGEGADSLRYLIQ